MSLKNKTIKGVGWNVFTNVVGVSTQITIGIVLARLLPPEDFGLIGLSMIIVGFGSLFVNLGLGPAIIQKKEINEDHIGVCFTISVLAGLVIGILVFIGADFIANILEDDRTSPLIQTLSIVFLINGFQIPSEALLKRRIQFDKLFYINFWNSIVYGVSTISLALLGYGVWSLVIGTILKSIVNLILNYYQVKHSLKLLFKSKEFYDLASFGSGMSLLSVFNYAATHGDYFIIGKLMGPHNLGLYSRAYSLMQLPTSKFVSVISNVLFPAASKIQSNNRKFTNAFLKTLELASFTVFPILIILIVSAPNLIIAVYGEKWRGAIVPFQILGFFGIFRALYHCTGSFLKAKGHIFKLFYSQVLYFSLLCSTVWIFTVKYGLIGASWAVGISIFVHYLVLSVISTKALNLNYLEVFKVLKPSIVLSIPLYILLFIFNLGIQNLSVHIFIELMLNLILGFITLLLLVIIIPKEKFNSLPIQILELLKSYLPPNLLKPIKNILIR